MPQDVHRQRYRYCSWRELRSQPMGAGGWLRAEIDLIEKPCKGALLGSDQGELTMLRSRRATTRRRSLASLHSCGHRRADSAIGDRGDVVGEGRDLMSWVATAPSSFVGHVVGNGQCIAYVQRACRAPHTSKWRRGLDDFLTEWSARVTGSVDFAITVLSEADAPETIRGN
jgi:hypothetical protein